MTGLCRDSISRIVPWFTGPKYGARCLYLITNSLGCCWLDTAEIYCPFSHSNFGHDSLRVLWPLYFHCNWCEHFVPGVTCIVPLRYLFTDPLLVVKSRTGYVTLMSFRHKIITMSKVNRHCCALITFTFSTQRLIYSRYQVTNHHYYCFVSRFFFFYLYETTSFINIINLIYSWFMSSLLPL